MFIFSILPGGLKGRAGCNFTLAATQLALHASTQCEVTDCSRTFLCEMGRLLECSNQVTESERFYNEVLSTPGLTPSVRLMCTQGLAFVYNKRKEWNKGAEFCKEALKLVPKAGPPKAVHMHLLVMLGDAMEGQGEWASARQSDEHAMAMWDAIGTGHKSASSVIGAWRREGIQLMRDGKPTLAIIGSMRHAPEFY